MSSSPPATIHPSELFLRDSGIPHDPPSHLCLAYYCPCGPLKSSPVSKESKEMLEYLFMTEIKSGVNSQPMGHVNSPDNPWRAGPSDIAQRQRIDDDEVLHVGRLNRESDTGDRGQFLMVPNSPFCFTTVNMNHEELRVALPQSRVAPTTSNADPVEEFDIDNLIKGFEVSPKPFVSPPKLIDEGGLEQAFKIAPALKPEVPSHFIPLESPSPLDYPAPHRPNAHSIIPLPPQVPTQLLSPIPMASQPQPSPSQTNSTTIATHPKSAESTGSFSPPAVANSMIYLGPDAQHVTAPFFQPQPFLLQPQVSSSAHPQRLLPHKPYPTQLWPTSQSAAAPPRTPSVSSPLPPSLVAYRPAPTMTSQQTRAPNRPHTPKDIHAPIPTRIFAPPHVATPNVQMIPSLRQSPVNATRQNAVSASYHPGRSTQHPPANSVSQAPGVRSDNLKAVSVRAPSVVSPPQFLQRELYPHTSTDSDSQRNVRHNMRQFTQQQLRARVYAAQVSSLFNSGTHKRSFDRSAISNPFSIMATNPKPPKRQRFQHALPTPQLQDTIPSSCSSQSAAFIAPHSETGPSIQMLDISNTLGVGASSSGRRRRAQPGILAGYKRFLGDIYACSWDRCGTTLSIGDYQKDRTAFEKDVFTHLEEHLPKELANGRKWHCRWSMGNSLSCTEELRDLKAIIRHIYSRHQASKFKCENCTKAFSRTEQFNAHKRQCNSASAVVEESQMPSRGIMM